MARPRIKDGEWLRIKNSIQEHFALIRIPGEARQVLDLIIRKTWGFQKKSDMISLVQFCKGTGLSKSNICRSLRRLVEMNLIAVVKNDKGIVVSYSVNKDYDSWKPLSKSTTLSKTITGVVKADNKSLSNLTIVHTKETNTKETITKDNKDILSVIKSEFNSNCKSLPKIRAIEESRKVRVNILLKKYPDLKWWSDLFKRVESSDFLSGRSGNWSLCGFDWILKPANLTKIIEGNYDNRGNTGSRNNPSKFTGPSKLEGAEQLCIVKNGVKTYPFARGGKQGGV